MKAVAIIEHPGERLSLDMPKSQSFEDWCAIGERLNQTERVLNWWIGDWWAAGTHRHGERAKAAAEGIFGKDFGTLMNAASVCRAFETSRRREQLSWTHHAEVAALPTAEADALLDRAEQERLSTRDLRVETIKRKVALGLFTPRDEIDDDPEYRQLQDIARRWNRSRVSVRQQWFELAQEAARAGFGEIDP